MAKVMRKEARHYAKAGSSLRRPPVPEHLPPKPESTYLTVLCSRLHLWLYGGLSPITISLGESLFLEVKMSTMGSCREPAWGTPPVAKVMRKEASAYAKAGSSLRKPSVPEHLPSKPESAYFIVLCSHLHLWLYGGLSPITSLREGVNLQLQLIKIPEYDKSLSTYELLWSLSSLPVQVRPTTCDCLQPPNCERHEMFKT